MEAMHPSPGLDPHGAGRARAEFDPELIRRFDHAGPRYTSYPTADRFGDAFGERAYAEWAGRRNAGGVERPLALYLHLPFCRDVCFYCACNKIVTRDAAKAARYLEYLGKEIERQAELLCGDTRVNQMHWGGGTPTFHAPNQLNDLFQQVARCFSLDPAGEYSIEIDPRTVNAGTMRELREIGFNRVSFGVQDFDPAVQVAIHRLQSESQTRAAIDGARDSGFRSISLDLIYGLPKQRRSGFEATLDRVIDAHPDRVALYNYAHLPLRFKPQRRIDERDLPAPEAKLELLGLAVERLSAAGYVHIGMDHFALPADDLAVAQRQGRLRRNFQGYSACADADLVGLGISAIGAIGPTYSQNQRELEHYYASLDDGRLPIARGIALTADDLVRRAVINALMCHFEVSRESISTSYLVDFDGYFAAELGELQAFEKEGMLNLAGRWISVTPRGRYMIRSICMVFDRYLRERRPGGRYSRVI